MRGLPIKRRIRFSLRTLLLAALFAGSAMLCWSVRDPWAFKKFPPFNHSHFESPNVGPSISVQITRPNHETVSTATDVRFSASDKYILVAQRSDKSGLFNIETGEAELDSTVWDANEFHPDRDWVLRTCKHLQPVIHQVVNIQTADELFNTSAGDESDSSFSKNGKILIIYQHQKYIRIFDTANWKHLSTTVLTSDQNSFAMIDDSHTILISSIGPSLNGYSKWIALKAINSTNGETLWKWKETGKFLNVGQIEGNDSKRQIKYCYQDWCSRSQYYLLDYDGKNSVKMLEDPPINFNRLGMNESASKDGRYILRAGSQIELRDNGKIVSELRAPSNHINEIGISNGAQFAAGIVDDNSVAVWTRRRQHFEWWGIYEQPEFWLTILLLIAFTLSIRRDRLETRNAKPETTSNPASTSPAHH